MEKIDNKEDPKKILNCLLQKLLDRRLYKLEKKNHEEECTLKTINKESQKAILALEDCSHKIRKQIYLLRNKYVDERKRNENILKNQNSSNNIEINKTRNSNTNNINTTSNIFNTLGNEKSIKKSEIMQHEKEEKIKRRKKRNITASPKTSKNLLLEKMKALQKSIKDLKEKNKSSKNIKKSHTLKSYLTVDSTPKNKSKYNTLYNSNSKRKSLKKSPANLWKTMNNFRNTNSGNNVNDKKDKEKETIDIHELSSNGISKEQEDIRLTELKLDHGKDKDKEIDKLIETSKKDLANQFDEIKTPSIDQPIFKDDSLLIKNISGIHNENNGNEDKKEKDNNVNKNTDNQNNDKDKDKDKDMSNFNINIDNVSMISNINLSKNNDILAADENEEKKESKKSEEIKSNISDEINKGSKNNINNIIIKSDNNNNLEYLVGDASINFTLIEPDTKNENDDNNKTIDLNISGLSDQLSLEEKFQNHLDDVIRYSDNRDIYNLLLVNKECFKTIMNFLISKTEIKIDILEEEIFKIIEENKNSINIDINNINNIKVGNFNFNANSSRAISLLNTLTVSSFLKIKDEFMKNKEIAVIFDIFFIAGGKNEIISIENMQKKWDYIFKFFEDYISKQQLGTFIEKTLNGKVFNANIINSLYKYSYKYLNIISPNHFQRINKDIAIMVFIIKDMLEHLAITTDIKINPEKELILVNSRLQSNKNILRKLNEINNKIN